MFFALVLLVVCSNLNALHFNLPPRESKEVEVKTSLFKVNYFKHQHAKGVALAVTQSYEDIISLRNSIESEFKDLGVTSYEKYLLELLRMVNL